MLILLHFLHMIRHQFWIERHFFNQLVFAREKNNQIMYLLQSIRISKLDRLNTVPLWILAFLDCLWMGFRCLCSVTFWQKVDILISNGNTWDFIKSKKKMWGCGSQQFSTPMSQSNKILESWNHTICSVGSEVILL